MDQLSKLVHDEAAKSGISKQQADKAVKMLKNGKVDMSQVVPHLKTMIMKNMSDSTSTNLRDKLAAKRQNMTEARSSKQSKAHLHDKAKKQIANRKEREAQEKQFNTEIKDLQKSEYVKSLTELESKIGHVSENFYNGCLLKLQKDTFPDAAQRQKCQMIVDLYQRQQSFTEKIAELDIDNESEISDISDDEMITKSEF